MNRTSMKLAIGLILGALACGGPARAGDEPSGDRPEWFASVDDGTSTRPDTSGSFVAKGRRSYSEERAWADARRQLESSVSEWLAPDVPTDWEAPEGLVDSLVVARHLEPVAVDREKLGLDPSLPAPGTLYLAGYRVQLDPGRRAELVSAYRHQVGEYRLTIAAGALGFVLACLAILAGYIRADEATRGYYTNRLRLVAAASAGAAGVALYRWLV